MEFEFDKEIDAILRKARGGETVAVFNSHLDADEISAFAENVLPEKTRQNYLSHLADCMRCRKILSNVIALNSAEVPTVSSAIAAQAIIETSIPWYRRLFAMPNLAYTLGALVLVFGGFLGFVVLNNFDNSMSSEVSLSNKAMPQTAPEFPSESSSVNANANSMPMANTASNSTTTTTTNSAPVYAANSAPSNSNIVTKPPQPVFKTEESRDENKTMDQDLARVQPSPTVNQPMVGGVTSQAEKKNPQDDKEESSKDGLRMNEQANKQKTTRSVPNPSKKPDSPTETTRQVSGKTFKKIGGTWFDSEYGTEKQISVRRGTSQYQNLDSGLRSIAEQFSGTVVILWKSKAYRIQ